MLKFIARGAAVVLTLAVSAPQALAWGDQGHAIVALVAEHFLKPPVRQKVDAMLRADLDPLTAHDIAAESVWADRLTDPRHASWRVMDLNMTHPDIDAACAGHPALPTGTVASAGPEKACILDKIDQFAAELASPATSAAERLLALKYLINLVGNLHEPLLVADNRDSHGMNARVSAGGFTQTTLRGFWDSGFIEELGDDPVQMADDLVSGISQSHSDASLAKGTPKDWALEAVALARDPAYGQLPNSTDGAVRELEAPYITAGIETVRLQLARAGVRLAKVLNAALAPRDSDRAPDALK